MTDITDAIRDVEFDNYKAMRDRENWEEDQLGEEAPKKPAVPARVYPSSPEPSITRAVFHAVQAGMNIEHIAHAIYAGINDQHKAEQVADILQDTADEAHKQKIADLKFEELKEREYNK